MRPPAKRALSGRRILGGIVAAAFGLAPNACGNRSHGSLSDGPDDAAWADGSGDGTAGGGEVGIDAADLPSEGAGGDGPTEDAAAADLIDADLDAPAADGPADAGVEEGGADAGDGLGDGAAVDGAPDGPECALAGCLLTLPMGRSTGTLLDGAGLFPTSYTLCPGGADPSANPPVCEVEVYLGATTWSFTPASYSPAKASGWMWVRADRIPIDWTGGLSDGSSTFVLSASSSECGLRFRWAKVLVNLELAAGDAGAPPYRLGCDDVSVTDIDVQPYWVGPLPVHECTRTDVFFGSQLRDVVVQAIKDVIHAGVKSAIEGRQCLR